MRAAPPAVATHIYRAFLLLYPPSFRLQFGDEMATDFDAATNDAWDARGWCGVLMLWTFVGTDLLRTVAMQWLRTGLPAIILVSAMWSTMMCTLIAQRLVRRGANIASLVPPKTDDEALLIMMVGAAIVLLLIVATIIITGCFWILVIRRRARA